MTTAREERLFWEQRARDLQREQLQRMRGAAGRLQAVLTGVLGGFAGIGFIWGPDRVSDLPLSGGLKFVVLGGLVVAGVLGLTALALVTRVSAGAVRDVAVLTGLRLQALEQREATLAHACLRWSTRCAGAATIMVFGAGAAVLTATVQEKPDGPAVIVDDGGEVRCGRLVVDGTKVLLQQHAERWPVPTGAKVTEISSACASAQG